MKTPTQVAKPKGSHRHTVLLLVCMALSVASEAAAQKLSVGIAPFDVVSVDGASGESGASMAKLLRMEMLKSTRLQPQLLMPAADAEPPLSTEQAAKLGQAAKVAVVLLGAVLEANTTSTSRGVDTGGLFGGLGVGARLNRVTAHVSLHIERIDPMTAEVVDTFDVEANASENGIGTDLQTELGSFNNDGAALDKSPLGKALKAAADKAVAEVAKRTTKL